MREITTDTGAVPTNQLTVLDLRYEPNIIANGLDVDRVAMILESAQQGDVTDMMCLYRDMVATDSHLQTELSKRKLAVLGDSLSVSSADDTDDAKAPATQAVEAMIKHCPSWIRSMAHLMDGVLYPLSVAEKIYTATPGGSPRYRLSKIVPVPHHLIDYTQGTLRIKDVDKNTGSVSSTTHDPDPSRYIVHVGHLLSLPATWGGPMRSILFWWLLSAMSRGWWARFLDKYGGPFLMGEYPAGDHKARATLETAFSVATRLGGLVMPEGTRAEIKQAAASDSGDAYKTFIELCQREKSKAILGQTLSATAQSTGLGSGVADAHEAVRSDIRQLDAHLLAETLHDQLISQFHQINGLSGDIPGITYGSEASSKEAEVSGAILGAISKANLELTDEGIQSLSRKIGFGIQRATSTPTILSAYAADQPVLARSALDSINRAASADISRAFRGSLAPVQKLIADSTGPADLEAKIRVFYADWQPRKLTKLIEQALVASGANGAGY